jgi:topoisomerase-4 subunit A
VEVYDFIGVKGYKAKGKRLTTSEVEEFRWLDPLPEPELPEESANEEGADENDETATAEGATENGDDFNPREGFAEGTQGTLF